MKLNTSYSQILHISLPIILGSAAQNIIVLSDNVFLSRYNSLDYAAVGLVGAFYLVLASIGFGFSRGGQIMIARKFGSQQYYGIGSYFKSLIFFEILMAVFLFLLLRFGAETFFAWFIKDQDIYRLVLEYIKPRSYGLFFSYLGVAFIALYTGTAHTKFILIDTVILTLSNLVLNYIFIFGHLGFEPMGIKGAAWASTLAEVIAFVSFVIYMLFDKQNRKYKLITFEKFDLNMVWDCFHISYPIMLQSILGLGAYFLFFTWIENQSRSYLEISNLIRNVYLILSIPIWGFSAGINTIVSNFIGDKKRQAVIPMIWKTSHISFLVTISIATIVLFFPNLLLLPLYGEDNSILIHNSRPVLLLLIPILALFSYGSIAMNGLMGTGHTKTVLWIQAIFTFVYLIYSFVCIKLLNLNLIWSWSAEFLYWGGIFAATLLYLYSKKWYAHKF